MTGDILSNIFIKVKCFIKVRKREFKFSFLSQQKIIKKDKTKFYRKFLKIFLVKTKKVRLLVK